MRTAAQIAESRRNALKLAVARARIVEQLTQHLVTHRLEVASLPPLFGCEESTTSPALFVQKRRAGLQPVWRPRRRTPQPTRAPRLRTTGHGPRATSFQQHRQLRSWKNVRRAFSPPPRSWAVSPTLRTTWSSRW